MQDRPTLHELLEAVERFLEEEIVPNAEGRRQFLARVSANVIRIVDREIAHEEAHALREWKGLDDLLGAEEPPPLAADRSKALARRTAQLSEKIRTGAADEGPWREQVLSHLRSVVRDKLSVSDPRLLERG